jgi:hypothetical protein
VLSWGKNHPTPVPIGGLKLPAGQTIGVFITTKFETGKPPPASPPHLNYVDYPIGSNPTFQNADLVISGGVGKANPLFTGTTYAEKVKVFSGGVLYDVGSTCVGDIDGDGKTCQSDLGVLLATYGLCEGDPGYNPAANLSQSQPAGCAPGVQGIDQSDLGALLADYGCGGCP